MDIFKGSDGSIILPCKDMAYQEYLNDCRKNFIEKIDRACLNRETDADFNAKDLPDEVLKEIKKAGYKVLDVIGIEGQRPHYIVSWGDAE